MDASKLSDLRAHLDDPELHQRFAKAKLERKKILAKYIKDTLNIDVDVNSIFDVQAKRLHAYKRQMLNCMNLINLYFRAKSDPDFNMYPRTFIFAAKAAPAYVYAKQVIHLINRIAEVVNNDPQVNKFFKVVFIPNYCVSIAEILMNAADVSEQISTAGKEASGTGNMKFMMNGAVTIGTLDGANVEIYANVGSNNIVIFGRTVEELRELRQNGYSSMRIYENDPEIRRIMDSLVDGTWNKNPDDFKTIYDDLLYRNDEYFLLEDYRSYCEAQHKISEMYQDRDEWIRKCLVNIATSGFFSSDRTIEDYNRDIWHLNKVGI